MWFEVGVVEMGTVVMGEERACEVGAAGVVGGVGCLVGLGVGTWGADGENLGSDEAEVVQLAWAVWKVESGALESVQSSFVQPADMTKINWETAAAKGLSEAQLRAAPPLHDVLAQFELFKEQLPRLALLTDGQLPIRQVLNPEAARKDVSLSDSYATFFDIRSEFRRLLPPSPGTPPDNLGTLADIMTGLGMEREVGPWAPIREATELVKVAARLASEAAAKGSVILSRRRTLGGRIPGALTSRG